MESEVNGWRSYTVMELQNAGLLLVEDGNHGNNRPLSTEFGTSGVSFIRAADMGSGRVFFESAQKINCEAMARIRKGIGAGGDVILSHKGTVGKVAFVPLSSEPFVCSPQTTFWRSLATDVIDRRYLFSFLNSQYFAEQLYSRANETDMAGYVSLTSQRTLSVILPPLGTQRAIAHILGSLDDKIALNRRMNETLEGMAQALFKSWFVDFDPVIDNALDAGNPIPEELADRAEVRRAALANGTANREAAKHFPSAFRQTEELGWIPEGWHIRTLGQATSAIIDHRGKTPKKMGADWTESGYPAVSAKNIKDGKLVRSDAIRFVDSELYERWMSEELQAGDLLMTSEAPLGEKLYLAQQRKWVLSQRLFGIRANETTSGVYLYHWLDTEIAKADIEGRASGTTVQGIRQSELRRVIVLTADKRCTAAFSMSSDPIMAKRETNELNSEALTKLRDTLLPQLISGELRIQDAEKLAEAALA